MQTYVRNPSLAVTDFARFAVDSCLLMAHVSKPSLSDVVKTSVIVLMVVGLFVGLLNASDAALVGLRTVGGSVLSWPR